MKSRVRINGACVLDNQADTTADQFEFAQMEEQIESPEEPEPFEIAGRPRSILFVSWRDLANPLAGGSELLIHQLASGLAERGYDVSLLCGGPVEPKSLYRVVDSGGVYSQYLRTPLRYLRSFRSADLVVEVCNGMPFFVPLWRRGPSICMVMHVHTELWSSRFGPLVAGFGRTVESGVLPRVHRRNLFVTISESSQSSLVGVGVPSDRIRILPHGVAEPPPLFEKSPLPRFVAVGRLVGYKRIDLLLEMWEAVREQTGGVLTIIGDGPDRERLEQKRVEGVEFTGFISEDEKHRLMSEARHPASSRFLGGLGARHHRSGVQRNTGHRFRCTRCPRCDRGVRNRPAGDLTRNPSKRAGSGSLGTKNSMSGSGRTGIKRALSYPLHSSVNEFERFAAEAMVRHDARSSNGRNRPQVNEQGTRQRRPSELNE